MAVFLQAFPNPAVDLEDTMKYASLLLHYSVTLSFCLLLTEMVYKYIQIDSNSPIVTPFCIGSLDSCVSPQISL